MLGNFCSSSPSVVSEVGGFLGCACQVRSARAWPLHPHFNSEAINDALQKLSACRSLHGNARTANLDRKTRGIVRDILPAQDCRCPVRFWVTCELASRSHDPF